MKKYLTVLFSEKGYDPEVEFMVEGPSGANFMAYQVVFDAICAAPAHERLAIKKMIIRVDFLNGDVRDYFRHLAQAIAL